MIVAAVRETFPGERRVALVPTAVPPLVKQGWEVRIESGAGQAAGFTDEQYREKGARIVSRDEAFAADCLLAVRLLGANPHEGAADLPRFRREQVVIGLCDPLGMPPRPKCWPSGVTLFSLESMPRITRAQSMDVLSCAGDRRPAIARCCWPRRRWARCFRC